MDSDSFITCKNTGDIYKGISKDVNKRLDTSNC